MAVKDAGRRTADADFVVRRDDGSVAVGEVKVRRPRTRVKIGGVFVMGEKASAAEVKLAVARSTDMLARLGDTIAKPGVRIVTARDVPLFSVDPDRPDRLIRRLNGKTEVGVLEEGAFKVRD